VARPPANLTRHALVREQDPGQLRGQVAAIRCGGGQDTRRRVR
jgi:hypothetical protein